MNAMFTTVGMGHDYAPSAVSGVPAVQGLLFAGAMLLGALAYRLCRRSSSSFHRPRQ